MYSFPSTSLTTQPDPDSATRGYDLIAELEITAASLSISARAFGPGGVTTIFGALDFALNRTTDGIGG
jgi:hypothetical protein